MLKLQTLLFVVSLGSAYMAYREGREYSVQRTRECSELELRLKHNQENISNEQFRNTIKILEKEYRSKCLDYDGTKLFPSQ